MLDIKPFVDRETIVLPSESVTDVQSDKLVVFPQPSFLGLSLVGQEQDAVLQPPCTYLHIHEVMM